MVRLSISSILKQLRRLYDPPKSFLTWSTPLDLVIATLLSAQCTDVRVNATTPALFQKYRTPEDYLAVPLEELDTDIRSINFHRVKAANIQKLCRLLIEKYHGAVPRTMEELTELAGVGRKTAAIVLYAAFDRCEGVAVDTHVARLSKRLGLTVETAQEKIERDLMNQTLRKDWCSVNPLFISHGRAVCTARSRRCDQCVFGDSCPSSLLLSRPDLAAPKQQPKEV